MLYLLRLRIAVFVLSVFFLNLSFALAAELDIYVREEKPIQGEPIMVVVDKPVKDLGSVTVSYDGRPLGVFIYKNKITAIGPTDLKERVGKHTIAVRYKDGTIVTKEISILERPRILAPLGIPEKLGGDTPASQASLVGNLSSENTALSDLKSKTAPKPLWYRPFRYPLGGSGQPVVTDEYGYSRQTGAYQIAHKGTDFRASEGTKVRAMNAGEVRLARNFQIYGNTVVVDHGLGIMTFYMHLSEIKVKEGEKVTRGEVVGYSGKTGYAEYPHLHVTVRIDGVSVDPMKFMRFFTL